MKHVREDKGGEGEEGGSAGWDGGSQLQLGVHSTKQRLGSKGGGVASSAYHRQRSNSSPSIPSAACFTQQSLGLTTASINMMCHMRQVQPLTCRSTSLPCSTALASLVSQGAAGAINTGMTTREHSQQHHDCKSLISPAAHEQLLLWHTVGGTGSAACLCTDCLTSTAAAPSLLPARQLT